MYRVNKLINSDTTHLSYYIVFYLIVRKDRLLSHIQYDKIIFSILSIFIQHIYYLLIDLGLPDGDGQDELIALRKSGEKIPIIILTARTQIDNLVQTLDSGADDFLPKPFAMPELISRVKAVSRRMAGFSSQIWSIGDLQLNPSNHQVTLNGELLLLSGKEYQLLYELMRNTDNVVRKSDLEQRLFGLDDKIESNSLEVHMHNLRRKIGKERIITVRGIGYLLKKEVN